jgi:hypothetical protein
VQYRLALTDEGYEKYGGSFKRTLKGMGADKPGMFFLSSKISKFPQVPQCTIFNPQSLIP